MLCTARLGLKAAALAWLEPASALSNLRPSQSRHSRLGSGLAWPRPRLLNVKIIFFCNFTRLTKKNYSESNNIIHVQIRTASSFWGYNILSNLSANAQSSLVFF